MLLEPSVEQFKPVLVTKYEYESLDLLIENTSVIFNRTRIGITEKISSLTGQCWARSKNVVKNRHTGRPYFNETSDLR